MVNHTAGPWHVDDLGEEFFLETNHRYGIGSDSGTGRVAKVEGFGDQYLANAHLIAAAPELLECCKAVVQACNNVFVDTDEIESWRAIAEQLRAAIAKAERMRL